MGGRLCGVAHWLLKSEPSTFGYEDLERVGREGWDGVRNYQARIHLRAMAVGDRAIFYHSSATPPGAAGICEIVGAAEADPTQFDPASPYYDPTSPLDDPRWVWVTVAPVRRLNFVSLTELPESSDVVQGLYCNRKSGLRFLEGVEDAFRRNERVSLESGALADEYEIFASKGQDPNWIRQLFSPTFIVWLTESAPEKFAFELEAGVLCCNVKGHRKHAGQLDEIRDTATAVAARIRAEVAEAPSLPG